MTTLFFNTVLRVSHVCSSSFPFSPPIPLCVHRYVRGEKRVFVATVLPSDGDVALEGPKGYNNQ